MSATADWTFISKKPFGVLMSAQTGLSLLILVLPYLAPFRFEGTSFVISCALSLLCLSVFMNVFHVYGWNRKILQMGNAAVFVPCALIMFFYCIVFGICFAFSTLIYVIAFLESLKHSITLIIVTALILVCSVGITYVNFQLVILLFRAAPNSQITALTGVIIEGTKTELLNGGPQFSPTGPPPSNPQFSV